MTAAMLSSMSNILMKLIGAAIKEEDWAMLVPCGLAVAFTATQTLAHVNLAQKYYN